MPRRIGKRLLFSLLPTVALWVVLELALAFLGVQPVTQWTDPLVGFDGGQSLFVAQPDAGGRDVVRTRGSKLVWFNDQQFDRQKPTGTRRIFCLGGSTTYGRPYDDTTSFAGWLREYLREIAPNTNWEVINAGGISYASYRVASVLEEVLKYEPDLIVIYAGNNEFLERRTYAGILSRPKWLRSAQAIAAKTRLYAALAGMLRSSGASDSMSVQQRDLLPGEVSERLNQTVGPQDYHRDSVFAAAVVEHYELNLRRMIQLAHQAETEIIFVTPAVNQLDMSPFKSEFLATTPIDSRDQVLRLLQETRTSLGANNVSEAVGRAARAVEIDAGYADSHYYHGKALFAASDFASAEEALRRAVDEDVCPLRATTNIVTVLRRVTKQTQVPLVPFDTMLEADSLATQQHSILGAAYFLDHVHPTIEANRKCAEGILREIDLVPGRRATDSQIAAASDVVRQRVLSRVDVRMQGVALRNLAKVLHWSGKFEEAAHRADDAIEILGADAESRLVLADCQHRLGEVASAAAHYAILFADTPEYARAYLPYARFVLDVASDSGAAPDVAQFQQIEYLLVLLGAEQPTNPQISYQLARLYFLQSELDAASDLLDTVNTTGQPVLAEDVARLRSQLAAMQR